MSSPRAATSVQISMPASIAANVASAFSRTDCRMDACSSEKTSCTHLVYTKCILPDNFTYLSIPIEWGLPLLSTLLFFKQSRTQQYVQKVDTAKACGKPYSYSPRLLSIQLNSTLLQQSQKLLTRVHPFSAHLLHLAMKCNSRHA